MKCAECLNFVPADWFCMGLERRMAFSRKISRADQCLLACPPDLSMRSSTATRWMHGLPLTCCQTIVPVLWILLSRLSILPISNRCREIHLTPSCTVPLWQNLKSESFCDLFCYVLGLLILCAQNRRILTFLIYAWAWQSLGMGQCMMWKVSVFVYVL